MVKIVVDSGHGGIDPGAVANGLREKDLNLDIGLGVAHKLELEYEDAQVILTRMGNETVSLRKRVEIANEANANFFLSLHVNAGGGSGFESFRHPQAFTNTKVLQYKIHDELMKFYRKFSRPDRGKKTANFYVLRETKMSAVLLENLFLDNTEEVKLLRTVSFRNELIDAITVAVAKALNLKRKAVIPGSKKLYRVQVGAFKYRKNAERLVHELKLKGYDAFIVES